MTKGQKINFYISGFVVAGLLLIVFGMVPLFKSIEKDSKEMTVEKGKLITLNNQQKNIEHFKDISKDFDGTFSTANDFFINAEVPVDFIKFLENTANDSRLFIDIAPGVSGKAATDTPAFLTFNLSLQGSYSDIMRFVEKVENSNYLIDVRSFNISKLEETGKSLRASLSVKALAK